MANSLTKWWETGELGAIETKVSVSDKTLVKLAITIILIYIIIALSGKVINKQ